MNLLYKILLVFVITIMLSACKTYSKVAQEISLGMSSLEVKKM